MRKENILLILWIIFGFIFIVAIESILYFLINLLYFGLAELGVSYNIMTYVFPIITLVLYSLTAFFLLERVKIKSIKFGVEPSKFPKKLLIILGITILVLTPLTEKLSGIYSESAMDDTQFRIGEYFLFYGWFNLGFAISQTLVLIIIVVYLFKKLKEIKDN
ncbi:hypothetical protein [Winogradskyella sp. MIT101101]|uniref:hypothetical protein n=1 Tax=Winogradskyella sp. MIT101101 TaxID=3098297 RepID=UPI003999542E